MAAKDVPFDDSSHKFNGNDQRHIIKHGDGAATCQEGHVITEYGIVAVYSQSDYTRLTFAQAGMVYRRVFGQGFTPYNLVTLAKRFAAEIAQE